MPDIAQAMTGTDDPINGDVAALRCDRALADLRKGRWVLMEGPRGAALVAAVDVDGEAPPVDGARAVAISSEKAADLGFAAPEGPLVLTPPANGHGGPGLLAAAAVALVAGQRRGIAEDWDRAAAGPEVAAALELLRRNQRMPAVLVRPVDRAAAADAVDRGALLSLDVTDVARLAEARARSIRRAGDARVPLLDSVDARFVVYREAVDDVEHVAIVLGRPDPEGDVLVRMHSACLTGDLFGSLRCDCGEQLRAAVAAIAEIGGGILLYLAQEGRGIGLTNKMRAYSLQDTGLDTLDADRCLGFGDDERQWEVAAAVLRDLGLKRVRLMTNNPDKIAALERHGIAVTERQALQGRIHEHNERYMRAKAERAGHLLDGIDGSAG